MICSLSREKMNYKALQVWIANLAIRDAEPEPEPPEPTHFGRNRSRSRRNGLLGAGAGAGAIKNGAAPAPKRDTIVARKKQQRRNNKKQPNKQFA